MARWMLGGMIVLSFGSATPAQDEAKKEWFQVECPTSGSKTSGLWFDNRNNGWLGRGECQEGHGLFRTKDGGKTWEAMPEFAKIRVNEIRRGPDGKLYGGGWNTSDNTSAWVFDATETKPVALFNPGTSAWTKVAQAENVAVTEDGQILVDSLTGVTFAYRPAGGEFIEARSFMEESLHRPDAAGWQVRRIVAFGNRFYACGSLINEPAMVFLPSKEPRATYHFKRLELQEPKEDGELLDMHVWAADRAIVVGINQSTHQPLAFVANGDLYQKDTWKRVDFKASGIAYKGRILAISVVGDKIVAVGGKVPTVAGGFILWSEDGGKSWKDITPKPSGDKVGELSNVWLFENGDIVAAGGGNEMWIYGTK